jgi:hypothetical protein
MRELPLQASNAVDHGRERPRRKGTSNQQGKPAPETSECYPSTTELAMISAQTGGNQLHPHYKPFMRITTLDAR